eukprot:CAMPEP_0114497692 /NCGR_PEP_ID=MMETSP0109-20121206/6469_1 /TAXON_ID=29199 /ORGANISM="Chlorarachnion reptans, Strain CCCM449" /LENGTH=312 /DNA_ID=CAMNT_0001675109 /DNA_START=118 /DNA_END=1057 /DNA_ORIENTATION=+
MTSSEATLVSVNDQSFIKSALAKGLRVDGRKPMKMRNVEVTFGRKAGLVNVRLGKTHVLAATSADVVKPYPNRPSENNSFHVDFSSMASPFYEEGRPVPESAQVARSIERSIRDSNAIDIESLCILSGSKVWEVRCDVRILDNDGNAGDCANLAAMASLMHFRRPDVTVVGEQVLVHSVNDRQPIPIALHHIPIRVSFVFFEDDASLVAIDPSLKESLVSSAEISYTVNKHKEICAINKLGGTPLSVPTILKYANVAVLESQRLTKTLEDILKEEEKSQQLRSRRGESVYTNPMKTFVDSIEKMEKKSEEKS